MNLSRLGDVLRVLSPPGVVATIWSEGDEVPKLFPEERSIVEKAVTKRQKEFARGRACARKAMAELGLPQAPILTGTHREPIWPLGVVGSITHCEGLIAAILARSWEFAGLGLDGEMSGPLPSGVNSQVFTEEEFERAQERVPEGGDPGKILFCAKESIYKAVFPKCGIHLDFLDVVVDLSPGKGTFSASAAVRRSLPGIDLGALQGRYAIASDFVLSICVLPVR